MHSTDGTDARNGISVADSVLEKTLSDFPTEDSRILPLVFVHLLFDDHRCHPGLAAPDRPRANAARLLIALQDLADAAMRDAQCPADDARSHSLGGQLNYLQTDVVRKRSAVDEDSA